MKYFVVTYVRSDDGSYDEHLRAHVEYLNRLVDEGVLRASGPLVEAEETSSMLILCAADRGEALRAIEHDPYVARGVVTRYTLTEWDPMFGVFQTPEHRLALSQLSVRVE